MKKVPSKHKDASNSLRSDHIKTTLYLKQVHRAKRDGSHPDIVRFGVKFQKELHRRGIPFYAFQYLRTYEESERLYKKGVSKARGGQSPHNWGLAVDVIHGKRLWCLTPTEWSLIGAIGKEVARKLNIHIEWGG